MNNFYIDTPEIKLQFDNPLMRRIVELKERGFNEAEIYDYAPANHDDAIDNYNRVLEIVGDICERIVAPNAECVDREGAKLEKGRVTYASGTQQNILATRQAGLTGVALPRRYQGLNFPVTIVSAMAEIISRADAGLQNIWGLESCADTIYEFGDEEQREKYLTQVSQGATMSMDLTEPDAGSDLQSVMLKATFNESENCWRLNGVKRFITNGDSDIHLVLARSEEGTHDGRGLSLFIYEKKNGGVEVRRIEDKMGIHGSPTCELVFKNAKAELCGDRRLGLIKYVMSLMNGARLGIASQSVGISDAAWRAALCYAKERKQFGQPIIKFPAVYNMISIMKAKLEASRSLLYETSRFVDIYKALEDISRERKLTPEERKECKKYSKLADAMTPLAKGISSEFANQNAYDSIQVHGGSGFMRDYTCERLYRDARITSIYEGTTQLQVVAAIRYITNKSYSAFLADFDFGTLLEEFVPLKKRVEAMNIKFTLATDMVIEAKNQEYTDFHSRRLYEMASFCIMSSLLLRDSNINTDLLGRSAKVFIDFAESEIDKHLSFITNSHIDQMTTYRW